MSEQPRCFISYSWDSQEHRDWVRKLATRLREFGVDVILDQFHLAPGADVAKFMEKSVRDSQFVLLVCTPTFARKADAGAGGVGYEKAIVTGEIFAGEARETKFVPLLREGDARESLPSYLKNRLFVDFRKDAYFESKLEELVRHFYGEPLYPPPPIGPKPSFGTKPLMPAPEQELTPWPQRGATPKSTLAKPSPPTPKLLKPVPSEEFTNSIETPSLPRVRRGLTYLFVSLGPAALVFLIRFPFVEGRLSLFYYLFLCVFLLLVESFILTISILAYRRGGNLYFDLLFKQWATPPGSFKSALIGIILVIVIFSSPFYGF
jgi:hypothetical protein